MKKIIFFLIILIWLFISIYILNKTLCQPIHGSSSCFGLECTTDMAYKWCEWPLWSEDE